MPVAVLVDVRLDEAERRERRLPQPAQAVGGDVGHDDDLPEAAESAFFSGTPEGEERSRAFAGPGQDVIEERERTAEHETVPDDETPDHGTGDGRARG